jgi:hypothetical protein
MTTDVIDQKTGQRVMSAVPDSSGNLIPLYTDGTTVYAIPKNGSTAGLPSQLYETFPDGTSKPVTLIASGAGMTLTAVSQKDANGNYLPVLDQSGTPVVVVVNGVPQPQYIPAYATQVTETGTNPRGRYALHFHRTGIDPTMPAASVNDVAVADSPGWGIVNHSSNVNVSNSVVFNATGAAYVTEAGDEIGSFTDDIAIHSKGAGGGIEDRKEDNDFGQLGDGFWLQGGDVALMGDIATGQRHSGFVFFPVGLNEGALGVRQIPFANLTTAVQNTLLADSPSIKALVAKVGAAAALVPDGDVPLLCFEGNTAFADGDGMETWFSLLDFTGSPDVIAGNSALQTVISDFTVWGSGGGLFDPYTNSLKFDHVTLIGNAANPGGTGFNINNVTANVTYHDVNVKGFNIGIYVPVNGTNNILGGTFDNLKSIYITTANDKNRVVNIDDASSTDPIQFQEDLVSTTTVTTKTPVTTTATVNGKTTTKTTTVTTTTTTSTPRTQWDIYLQTNYNPKLLDITTFFNPDIIRLGTVRYHGQQLYYNEQAATYTPFPSTAQTDTSLFGPQAASYIPAGLQDMTNAALYSTYGLAIGGIVAPSTANHVAGIYGLIGPASTYLTPLQLVSAKYVNQTVTTYFLSYKYWDPNRVVTSTVIDPKTKVRSQVSSVVPGWVQVTETVARPLVQGWNLLTITLPASLDPTHTPNVRTLLVYGDDTPPSFQLNTASSPLVINQADIDNGSTYHISGNIVDDSFGTKHFETDVKLNDFDPLGTGWDKKNPNHVEQVDANHILVVFPIYDLAGNRYIVEITLTVTNDAPLLRDIGQKTITTIPPSTVLISVIQVIDAMETPVIMGVADPTKNNSVTS